MKRETPPTHVPELVLQLTTSDLRALMVEAVAGALADYQPAARPTLLDQATLAQELSTSTRTIYALRQAGLPHIMLGDSPRFELAAVLAWLRVRDTQAADSAGGHEHESAVTKLDSRKRRLVPARAFQHEPAGSNDSEDLGRAG